jgi:hypothetical protein
MCAARGMLCARREEGAGENAEAENTSQRGRRDGLGAILTNAMGCVKEVGSWTFFGPALYYEYKQVQWYSRD